MAKSIANPNVGVGLDASALDAGLAKIRDSANRALSALERRNGPSWLEKMAESGRETNRVLTDTRTNLQKAWGALSQANFKSVDPAMSLMSAGSGGVGSKNDAVSARLKYGAMGAMAGSSATPTQSYSNLMIEMMAKDKARLADLAKATRETEAYAMAYGAASHDAETRLGALWADSKAGLGRLMRALPGGFGNGARAVGAGIDSGLGWAGAKVGGALGWAATAKMPMGGMDTLKNAMMLNGTLDLIGKISGALGNVLQKAVPKSDQIDAGVKAGGQSLADSTTMTGTLGRLSADWDRWIEDSWKRFTSVFDLQSWAESGRGAMAAFTAIWEGLFGKAEDNTKTAEQLLDSFKGGAMMMLDTFGGVVELSIQIREVFWGIIDSLWNFMKNIPGIGTFMGSDTTSFKFNGDSERQAVADLLAPIREQFDNMTVKDFTGHVDPVETDKAATGLAEWTKSLEQSKTGLDAINSTYTANINKLDEWANKLGSDFLETDAGIQMFFEAIGNIEAQREKGLGDYANSLISALPDAGSFNVAGMEMGSAGAAAMIANAMSDGLGGKQSIEEKMIEAIQYQNDMQSKTADNTAQMVGVLTRLQPGQTLSIGGPF
jgi:hypothetical protein